MDTLESGHEYLVLIPTTGSTTAEQSQYVHEMLASRGAMVVECFFVDGLTSVEVIELR